MRQLRRLTIGATIGLAAAATAIGTAELVAASSPSWQSPVLDVADRVVDGVPNTVKELAIDWFGTNDKIALLVGIGSILAAAAVLIGIIATGRRTLPWLAAVAGFGLVGVYASQSTRRSAPLDAVVPSLTGTLVAVLVVWRLSRRLVTRQTVDAPRQSPSIAELTPTERRRFVVTAAAVAAGAVAAGATGRRLSSTLAPVSGPDEVVLPPATAAAPPPPGGIEVGVPGVAPFFTPTRDFYRIDTALTVPRIALDDWRLDVDGRVERPLRLRFADLLDRRLVEADITLTCVSNEVGGKLVGTARWLGVPLADLLDEAGVDPTADQVVGRSVDGYTCGFPTAALDGRDALVAVGMNGAALPLAHGFPARLVVPGLYGYVSATKWLRRVELTRFDEFDQYWVRRGWVDDAPIHVQSRIDTPRGLATLPAGRVAIAGVAWAQTRGVERVEVQVDGGEWEPARLADELNDTTWRQWVHEWDAAPGRHTIAVRATERNGPIQTAVRAEPFPSGATGRHQIVVLVE